MKHIKNSAKGSVFYGMHFYPGLAQYNESDGSSFKVFLNDDTIRKMGKTFEGCPVFVDHVSRVDSNLDNLRGEADGYVVESFYNSHDGKHWVKFMITSKRGLEAIQKGYRLSNAYEAKLFGNGGVWNGIDYDKEVLDGEFEHLALVEDPRYDESIVMTPEDFKSYNEDKESEAKRLRNSKDNKGEGTHKMKFNMFKKTKVENSADFENHVIELPQSKKQMTLGELVEAHDKFVNMHGYANDDHMVKVGDGEMSVKDLVKKHMDLSNEMSELKKAHEKEGEAIDEEMHNDEEADEKAVGDRGGDESLGNPDEMDMHEDHGSLENEDEDGDEDKDSKKDKMKNEAERKKAEAREKALRLKNAQKRAFDREDKAPVLMLNSDRVALGKKRYGNK